MNTIVIGIKENILQSYKRIIDDQYHRYRSWEHCYLCFQRLRSFRSDENVDTMTLHIAFYLASWGMYRGSSQLLQKDYKVHTSIVLELIEEKYSNLWHLNFDAVDNETPEISLVIQLARKLKSIYADLQISPTDTLVTKVLLGTFGCIPAYDTLFINGVTYWKKKLSHEFKPKFSARFGIKSYYGLIDFYREHKSEFKEAHDFIEEHDKSYPVMKLVDMYFWSLGEQLEIEKKKKKLNHNLK